MKPKVLAMRRLFPERHYSSSLLGYWTLLAVLLNPGALQAAESWSGRNIPGYRGIWCMAIARDNGRAHRPSSASVLM